MSERVRFACAAIAAALVMACSSSGNQTVASQSPVCSGAAIGYWSSTAGQAGVTQGDLAYLGTFDACSEFGPFGNTGQLAAYLETGRGAQAPEKHGLCAAWFAFALNARHDRFHCSQGDVLFELADAQVTFSDVEGAVRTGLALGSWQPLADFFAAANGGASVCACGTPTGGGGTGGTGGTGASGSWGE